MPASTQNQTDDVLVGMADELREFLQEIGLDPTDKPRRGNPGDPMYDSAATLAFQEYQRREGSVYTDKYEFQEALEREVAHPESSETEEEK